MTLTCASMTFLPILIAFHLDTVAFVTGHYISSRLRLAGIDGAHIDVSGDILSTADNSDVKPLCRDRSVRWTR